jgi:hypothetical protein
MRAYALIEARLLLGESNTSDSKKGKQGGEELHFSREGWRFWGLYDSNFLNIEKVSAA